MFVISQSKNTESNLVTAEIWPVEGYANYGS